jgi:hypothetical protein
MSIVKTKDGEMQGRGDRGDKRMMGRLRDGGMGRLEKRKIVRK